MPRHNEHSAHHKRHPEKVPIEKIYRFDGTSCTPVSTRKLSRSPRRSSRPRSPAREERSHHHRDCSQDRYKSSSSKPLYEDDGGHHSRHHSGYGQRRRPSSPPQHHSRGHCEQRRDDIPKKSSNRFFYSSLGEDAAPPHRRSSRHNDSKHQSRSKPTVSRPGNEDEDGSGGYERPWAYGGILVEAPEPPLAHSGERCSHYTSRR